jgi:hypothetical protein
VANPYKKGILDGLAERFGQLHRLARSQSLYVIGEDAARVYLRYSRMHERGCAFYGLRDVDLRQLEGHNSFICFFLDDGSEPLFVPYAEFEDVFRNAEPASDGQHKVHFYTRRDAAEITVAGQGRFNVEGFVGFDALAASLEPGLLRGSCDLTHSQVQTLLAAIGCIRGFDVRVPENDVARLDRSLATHLPLRQDLPARFGDVASILSEVDVVWVARGRSDLGGLFEVEHSTPVYSALLRFNDVHLAHPRQVSCFSVVSNDSRRMLFSRQVSRPTFRQSGLTDLVSFLDYNNVLQWHARLTRRGEVRGTHSPRATNSRMG